MSFEQTVAELKKSGMSGTEAMEKARVENEAAFASVIGFCRRISATPIGIQLNHAGRKGSTRAPWLDGGPLTDAEGAWVPDAPSAIPYLPDWETPAALDAIRAVANEAPEMIVGAGTVLGEKDLNAAIEAGAKYALSPGGTPKLMKAARKASIPFVPGVATSRPSACGPSARGPSPGCGRHRRGGPRPPGPGR